MPVIEKRISNVGFFLELHRKDWGYSQKVLCEKVGISQEHYSQIKSGKNRPSLKVTAKLKSVLCFCADGFGGFFEVFERDLKEEGEE